jgi:uncharacterized protein involved in outer membrane biogenesis
LTVKRALLAVPAILIVLIIAALVGPSFVDWNKYKPQAVAQIKAATGYDVALNGDIGMRVLPSPRILIESVDVKSPAGSTEEHLVRVKRLEVNLAMGPLLGGKVDFSSVNLVEPDIALEVLTDNKQNWMTPELEAMTKKDPSAPVKAKPQIALRDVSVEKGRLIYRGGKDTKPVEVSDVNVDLSADTLSGPFTIDGTITTGGQTIEVDGKTGAILEDAKSVSVNVEGTVKPLGVDIKYAGVVGLSEPYDVQGETEIKISDLAEKTKASAMKLEGEAMIKGLVTGSTNGAMFKDSVLSIAGNEFRGDIGANFNPVKVAANLVGAKTINLDEIIKKDASAKSEAKPGSFLPATIELPASFEADIALTAPGLVYNAQTYKDVTLKFVKSESVFTAAFAAGEMPGKGNIDVKGDLKFASKSLSKTGAEIYSDPTLAGSVKGQTQNIAQTMEALTGMRNPALESFKTGAIEGGFSVAPDVVELKSSTLRLGDMNMNVAAAYSPRGTRPALALDVTADAMNFDDIMKRIGGGQKTGSAEDSLRNLKFPMDIDFDVGVQKAVYQGQNIEGLRAVGTARDNSLKFTNLSSTNFAGSTFKLEGGVGDLKNLKGIDLKFAGESSDPKGVLKMAGIDPATLPANIEKAGINATASGDISKLAVKAGIKALGGEVIASGDVANPTSDLKISGMAVQVKHSNMNDAFRIFAPGTPQYASWNKPMDVYAEIETSGKAHNFKNIKGTLANATIAGNMSFDQSGAKPALKGDLTFGDMILVSDAKAAAAVSKGSSQAPAATRSSGRWSSEPINPAWMNAMDIDVSLKAKSLTYETWALSQPSLAFILRDGALQIKDLKSGIYGGQMAMNATMKSSAGKGPLAVETQAKFSDVQVESMVASLARGTRLIKGTGKIDMDINAKSSGSSQQALISGLSGGGTTTGSDIVLDGFDLTRFGRAMSAENKPGDTLLGLYKTSIKGGSTAFDTMDGAYTINQGVVNILKLNLDGPTANVGTKGNINLPSWTIATDHTITLKGDAAAEVPPFTIKIAGSLDNPGQTFGQGLIQDYFNRKIERKIQNVIQDKLADELGGDDALGNALGSLLGVKKPAPKAPVAPAPSAQAPAPAPASTQTAIESTPTAEPAAGEEAAPVQPAPAPVQEAQPPAEQAPQREAPAEPTPEEAMEGLLKGLINGQ